MKLQLRNPQMRQKAILLGGLYTSQMLGLSFIVTAFPVILRHSGAGLSQLGWIYMLGFLWSFNFLWAPLVDRFGSQKHGHYRSWILVMQSLLILIMIGASFFTVPDDFAILMLLFAFLATFSATQDVSADALATTILKPEERGLGNSIQAAGSQIGCMVGGGVVLITYQWLGWQGSMLALAAVTALPLISVLALKEKPAPADCRKEKVDFRALIHFFLRPGMWRWITILMVFRISNTINYGLVLPILVDLGWSLGRIGFAINIIGTSFGVVGSALGGWTVSRWGRKSAMLVAMLLVILGTIGLLVPALGIENPAIAYVAIGLIMTAYGCSFAAMYSVIMDKSDPTSAGTDFTLQLSLSSFSAVAAMSLAMKLAEAIGYAGVLTGAVGIGLLSMVLIWLYDDFELVSSPAT